MWNSDCTIATVLAAVLTVITATANAIIIATAYKRWRPWYARLAKPRATPPPGAYGIAFTVVYILITSAGILSRYYYEQPGRATSYDVSVAAQVMYYAQFPLIVAWCVAFFSLRSLIGSVIIITGLTSAMISATALYFVIAWQAGLVLLWAVLWAVFATILNISMLVMNSYMDGESTSNGDMMIKEKLVALPPLPAAAAQRTTGQQQQ